LCRKYTWRTGGGRTPRETYSGAAQWVTSLYNSGVMNLLDIPHFGHGKNVGLCVKQLLARVHGGILWMDKVVPIDVDLIAKITGISYQWGKARRLFGQ
jgi:hypothetical protein